MEQDNRPPIMHTYYRRAKKENPGNLAKTVNLFGEDFELTTRGNG